MAANCEAAGTTRRLPVYWIYLYENYYLEGLLLQLLRLHLPIYHLVDPLSVFNWTVYKQKHPAGPSDLLLTCKKNVRISNVIIHRKVSRVQSPAVVYQSETLFTQNNACSINKEIARHTNAPTDDNIFDNPFTRKLFVCLIRINILANFQST